MFDIVKSLLGDVLGSKTSSGSSQLLELFKGNREKEREFQLKLEAAFEDKLKLRVQDVQDARKMQIAALSQNDWFAKNFLNLLTMFILSITAFLAVFPLFVEIPVANEAMLTRATDFFYMIAGGSVIGFFFGTNTKIFKK